MNKRRIRESTDPIRMENEKIFKLLEPTTLMKNMCAKYIVEDLRRFLDENYKGCYDATDEEEIPYSKMATTRPYYFAFFMKVIFRSVWGNQMIRVKSFVSEYELIIQLFFDTTKITQDELELLKQSADKGDFTMVITNEYINIVIDLFHTDMITVYEKRIPFIYNHLRTIFHMCEYILLVKP